jgi:hypothetical protein
VSERERRVRGGGEGEEEGGEEGGGEGGEEGEEEGGEEGGGEGGEEGGGSCYYFTRIFYYYSLLHFFLIPV